MAKPNYSFEKRQRELAKKKKKEEKDREKAARKANPQPADGTAEPDTDDVADNAGDAAVQDSSAEGGSD